MPLRHFSFFYDQKVSVYILHSIPFRGKDLLLVSLTRTHLYEDSNFTPFRHKKHTVTKFKISKEELSIFYRRKSDLFGLIHMGFRKLSCQSYSRAALDATTKYYLLHIGF
jgi:hypothetical protein